ncbi:MAG: cephalosporin hydroxylase [Rhizobiales bacterium 24-66-13]|jgi:cephalosporin hydroxylase|nr:MAG: cephalosporin hydroxylase [Rhizobiales bacterium 12-66-7]OYZ70071.1 MAG: cephalosporin hydroxylase [Rhizobiales bacterium 24-66-13]OZB07065.1 MAG: cephalosporin hydroxylase [Rhizobiales bacterium 39-66-18]HQS08405.1 CmcI family methyltransferase [Xanthobacteraceae bacterium]HQS47564.1 CmcI family methyltransferase [Xanthobacteraceae bacterium]
MTPDQTFAKYVAGNIAGIGADRDFLGLSNIWVRECIRHNYAQNFTWLGRPIIQVPQDVYAIQELIWRVKPDLVIETGIAHGGSLILSASMLAMIEYCEAMETGTPLDPRAGARKVIGVDIDIRAHNRAGILAHPLARKIEMIEGSSIDDAIVARIRAAAAQAETVMVFLDSNHTHAHVLSELELYAPMVSQGSYVVVWDTGVEDLPAGMCADRPWGKGDNPKTAVWDYLRRLDNDPRHGEDGGRLRFEIDKVLEHKLAITAAPDGFLRRL